MRTNGSGSTDPVVAVDLGGTNTRVALVSHEGTVMDRTVERTAREDMHPMALVALVDRVASDEGATRAVIGVPGRVDHAEGRLEFAPNLPELWAKDLTEERLSASTGLAVSLANDCDLAAVGEHRFGAGRGVDDMVYLSMSTGVGCGVILGGLLVHGRRSMAEVGHTVIDRSAAPGMRTLEETASGTAMNRLASDAGLDLRGADLLEAVRRGDPQARGVWDLVVAAAGTGVANLAHLFSPELIIIGGGLGLTGDMVYEPLRHAVATAGPKEQVEPIRIERAALGDDAGLVGAAGWHAAHGEI